MNYCLKCGCELSADYKFCPGCGMQIRVVEGARADTKGKKCPNCGFTNLTENTFCTQCGTDLRDLLME